MLAWQDGAVGGRTAGVFYPISIVEEDKILEKCREIHPDAIVTIATDLGGAVVNDPECSLIATNKYEMRRALQKAGIPVPGFVQVDTQSSSKTLDGLKFPMIVKPTDRSGSRGVTQVDCIEDWMKAVRLACEQSFERKAITEEYLMGQEYSCECISYQGKHTNLTFKLLSRTAVDLVSRWRRKCPLSVLAASMIAFPYSVMCNCEKCRQL